MQRLAGHASKVPVAKLRDEFAPCFDRFDLIKPVGGLTRDMRGVCSSTVLNYSVSAINRVTDTEVPYSKPSSLFQSTELPDEKICSLLKFPQVDGHDQKNITYVVCGW